MQPIQSQRFACFGCGHRFSSRDELQRHLRICSALQGAEKKEGEREKTKTAGSGGDYGEG
jgi:uncharacterized Zn-finger protein